MSRNRSAVKASPAGGRADALYEPLFARLKEQNRDNLQAALRAIDDDMFRYFFREPQGQSVAEAIGLELEAAADRLRNSLQTCCEASEAHKTSRAMRQQHLSCTDCLYSCCLTCVHQ